ncbi:hypothetical protein C8J57DRAFT_1256298 [Mycena rebaudengoi]|nr:hypothetical protein C8J57DRAFT_1256298 [Mycena rebaudengoi]
MKIDAQLPLTPGLDGNVLIWQGVSLLHIGITALKIRYSRVLALMHLELRFWASGSERQEYHIYALLPTHAFVWRIGARIRAKSHPQVNRGESNPAPYLSSSRIHWVFATHLIICAKAFCLLGQHTQPQNFKGANRISSLHSSEVIEAAKHEIMGILVICTAQGESEGQIPATTEIGTCRAYRKIPMMKFSPLAGASYRVLKAPGGTRTGKSPKIP